MAYVICEPCVGVKDKACVSVCPVDCITEGVHQANGKTYDMLFISPGDCIDCGLCEPACPVTAIFADTDVPKEWAEYVQINASFFN